MHACGDLTAGLVNDIGTCVDPYVSMPPWEFKQEAHTDNYKLQDTRTNVGTKNTVNRRDYSEVIY